MTTWSEYKERAKQTNPEIKKDIEEIEAFSRKAGTSLRPGEILEISQSEVDAFLNASRPYTAENK